MDRRGGCCIARYTGSGAYDMSKVHRIMLRYRPIAPKPAAAAAGSGASASGGSSPDDGDVYIKAGRGKRKYVSKRCNNSRKKKSPPCGTADSPSKTSSGSGGSVSGGERVVTLPLLPETPDRKESPAKKQAVSAPIWLSFGNSEQQYGADGGHVAAVPDRAGVAVAPQPVRLVTSCVTVECVTEMWDVGALMGCTNEERMMDLERDTCPGFISDGYSRVVWTNTAYREMVGQVDGGGEMRVWLVMKELVSLPVTCGAFACRVRVVTCGSVERSSTTVPCDVWRMVGGGFAWRLDVKAALCLGR